MKEKGMGRTRLGRFAAVTVPATAISAGLGFAIVQGMVGAALASSSSFQVAGTTATGDALELTANYASAASSETTITATNKKSAMVSLKNGKVSGLCLAADTTVPVFGVLGLKITGGTAPVSLGAGWTDLNADSVAGDSAILGTTKIGYAQDDLIHQDAVTSPGYTAGGFSMATDEAPGAVNIQGLDGSVYALTLNGLNLSSGLNISATPGVVEGTC